MSHSSPFGSLKNDKSAVSPQLCRQSLLKTRDTERALLAEVCERLSSGEGLDGYFFRRKNKHLFIGDYRYWLMTPCREIELGKADYLLNCALIHCDRRVFLTKDCDDGERDRTIDHIFNVTPNKYYAGD